MMRYRFYSSSLTKRRVYGSRRVKLDIQRLPTRNRKSQYLYDLIRPHSQIIGTTRITFRKRRPRFQPRTRFPLREQRWTRREEKILPQRLGL